MDNCDPCRVAFENSYTDNRWMERDGDGYKRNGVDYDWIRWKRAWNAANGRTRRMDWRWNDEHSRLEASSVFHDDGVALLYVVSEKRDCEWEATFEGSVVCCGSLMECLVACSESEAKVISDVADMKSVTMRRCQKED